MASYCTPPRAPNVLNPPLDAYKHKNNGKKVFRIIRSTFPPIQQSPWKSSFKKFWHLTIFYKSLFLNPIVIISILYVNILINEYELIHFILRISFFSIWWSLYIKKNSSTETSARLEKVTFAQLTQVSDLLTFLHFIPKYLGIAWKK